MDTRSTPQAVSTQTTPIDQLFCKYVNTIKRRDAARANADRLKKDMNREWVKYYAANKEVDELTEELGLNYHPPAGQDENGNYLEDSEEDKAPKKTKRKLTYNL